MRNSDISNILLILALACQINLHFQVQAVSSFQTNTQAMIQGATILSTSDPKSITSISSAGDFNGDGYEDIVIGIPEAMSSGITTGLAYVIFGTVNGITDIDLANITPQEGIKILGDGSSSRFGYSVSGLGDVNGDDIDDIIIGSPDSATAYVIFGKKSGFASTINVGTLGTGGIKLTGPPSSFFATEVSRAGDVNGDGINDILISASGSSPFGRNLAGSVYIIYGKAAPSSVLSVDSMTEGIIIHGSNANEGLGTTLNVAGDVNKDGIADIMIEILESACGTSNLGIVLVVYGKSTSASTLTVMETDTMLITQGFKICRTSTSTIGGLETMRSVGDLNNDGVDDLAIGFPSNPVNSQNDAGSIFIVNGKAGGFTADVVLSATSFSGFVINGATGGDQVGKATASGDINGDGILDLVFTTYRSSGPTGPDAGVIYIIFGNKNGFSDFDLTSPGPLALKIFGETNFNMGTFINNAKDINGDGINDILALGNQKAFIIYGSPCGGLSQCASTLPPVCYIGKGCKCGESPGFYFQINRCIQECSEGYYLENPICETCPTSCSVCTSPSDCQSCNSGFILEGTSCVQPTQCTAGYIPEGSICKPDISGLEEINTINSVTDVTHKIDTVSLTAAGVIAPHDPGSVTAGMLAKMLQYSRYLDIPYSQRLEQTFKYHNSTYGPFGIGPKMPRELLLEVPLNPIPLRFLKFHVHSNFLVNFWDNLIFITIISGTLLILVLIEYTVVKIKGKKAPYPIIKNIRAALQNFCLMQFYNMFGDVLLFLALDLRRVTFDTRELTISFCISILFCLIGCIILVIHISILMKFFFFRKKESWASQFGEFSKHYEGSDVLFKHFKDNSFFSQSFLLIFVIRNLFFNLVLALLSEIPLAQAILIFSMTVSMFLYLLIQRPFKSVINLLQHLTCELIFLVVNVCILVLAQLKFENQGSYELRDELCEAIIYTSLIFSFVPQVFLALKLSAAALDWYKTSNNKSLQAQKNITKGTVIKRHRKTQDMPQHLEYQKSTLDESSVGLNIPQNTSNLTSHLNDSSFINERDSPTQTRKKHLLNNNVNLTSQRQQQSQGTVSSPKKTRETHHQRFHQQADRQISPILRSRVSPSMMKPVNEMNMLPNSFSGNSPKKNHWARSRTTGNQNRVI